MELFFELILVALGQRQALSKAYSADEWQEAFSISGAQAVEGVALMAAEQLPPEQQPSKELMMQWTYNSAFFASKNARLDKAAQRLVENFARVGWKSCILKGQGIATLYPVPSRRQAGDIDVWIDAPPMDIIKYARKYCPDCHSVYYHIDFPIWEGISIELHFFPSFLYAPDNNKHLREFFRRSSERVMAHKITLGDGTSTAVCADSEFNAVYLLCHLFNHLMEEVIVVRQYMDYYYVLRDIKDDETRHRIAKEVERIGLKSFARGVMYVMGEIFSLEREYMFVEPDAYVGRFLQKELMRNDALERIENRKTQRPVSYYINRTRRSISLMRYFPKECVWSPFVRAYYFLVSRLRIFYYVHKAKKH